MASDEILILTESNFDDQITSAQGPVLVDFWASWCQPCKTVLPSLEELAKEYKGRAKVAKVDVNENGDLANRFGVRSIPTMIVFCDGKVVDQMVGAAPKTDLKRLIDKQLA
jgi:thioredoxin 1